VVALFQIRYKRGLVEAGKVGLYALLRVLFQPGNIGPDGKDWLAGLGFNPMLCALVFLIIMPYQKWESKNAYQPVVPVGYLQILLGHAAPFAAQVA